MVSVLFYLSSTVFLWGHLVVNLGIEIFPEKMALVSRQVLVSPLIIVTNQEFWYCRKLYNFSTAAVVQEV